MVVRREQLWGWVEECGRDYLALLQRCSGYYACPKDSQGRRIGPLVAYRGEYSPGKRYVGEVYANFAKIEQYPVLVSHLARELVLHLREAMGGAGMSRYVMCAAPEGGKALAFSMAEMLSARYIYPEKKGAELVWGRHTVEPGERVIIVEDVSNNFATTAKLVKLITAGGGEAVWLASFLNRSKVVEDRWLSELIDDGQVLPVAALVRKRIDEWRQDDPCVAADVAAGNVVWEVKNDWERLEGAMVRAGFSALGW